MAARKAACLVCVGNRNIESVPAGKSRPVPDRHVPSQSRPSQHLPGRQPVALPAAARSPTITAKYGGSTIFVPTRTARRIRRSRSRRSWIGFCEKRGRMPGFPKR